MTAERSTTRLSAAVPAGSRSCRGSREVESDEKEVFRSLLFFSEASQKRFIPSSGEGAKNVRPLRQTAEEPVNSSPDFISPLCEVWGFGRGMRVLRRVGDLLQVLVLLAGVYVSGIVDGVSLHRCFFFLRNCPTILKRTIFCFFINGLFAAAAVAAGQLATPIFYLVLRVGLRLSCGFLWSMATALATLADSEGADAAFERAVSALAASGLAAEAVTRTVGSSLEALAWFALKYGVLYPVYLLSSFYFDVAEHGLALLRQEEKLRLRVLEAEALVQEARVALEEARSEEAQAAFRQHWDRSRRVLSGVLSESHACAECRWGVWGERETPEERRRLFQFQQCLPASPQLSASPPDALLLKPVLQYAWWVEASLLLPLVPVFGPCLASLNNFWMAAFWCFDRRRRKGTSPSSCRSNKRQLRRSLSRGTLAALGLSPANAETNFSFRRTASQRYPGGGCVSADSVSSVSSSREAAESVSPLTRKVFSSSEQRASLAHEVEEADAATAFHSWLFWFECHWCYFAGFGTPVCFLLQCLQRAEADNAELAAAAILLPLSVLLALRASPRRCFANSPEKAERQLRLLLSFPVLNRMPIFAFLHIFADLAVHVLGGAFSSSQRDKEPLSYMKKNASALGNKALATRDALRGAEDLSLQRVSEERRKELQSEEHRCCLTRPTQMSDEQSGEEAISESSSFSRSGSECISEGAGSSCSESTSSVDDECLCEEEVTRSALPSPEDWLFV